MAIFRKTKLKLKATTEIRLAGLGISYVPNSDKVIDSYTLTFINDEGSLSVRLSIAETKAITEHFKNV